VVATNSLTWCGQGYYVSPLMFTFRVAQSMRSLLCCSEIHVNKAEQMAVLISGVLLFALVHFIPSLAPSLKAGWQEKAGENGYKGVFSLLLLASFGLMILGWRGAEASFVYAPSTGLRMPALLLMVVGFIVMATSNRQSRIRLLVRHPQLMGVTFWSTAHLLLNGDSRSVVLFGGLLIWSIIEMFAINRRDGVWIKEPVPGWGTEAVNLLIGIVTIAVFVFAHPWLSGVAVV
jgi:NnrU protein